MSPPKFLLLAILLSGNLVAQSLPAGTALPIMLSSGMSPKSKPGQKIEGKLMQDVYASTGILKAGAHVTGQVLSADKGDGSESWVALRFESVIFEGINLPLSVYVRAIGTMNVVAQAQQPINALATYIDESQWSTKQIGGEGVSRTQGYLVDQNQVVGHWTDGAVVGKLRPNPDRGCTESDKQDVALWLFSTTACGVYGDNDLNIADSGKASGQTVLSSNKDFRLRGGSAWLLITR